MFISNTNAKNVIMKKKRPLGVWLLTIYALIITGFDLLFSDSYYVLKGEVAMYNSNQVPYILLWAYITIGIIIASILTWAGWELGRILFLLLISIFYLAQIQLSYTWINHRDFEKDSISNQVDTWFHLIEYILILILYIWYFNKPSVKEFFRRVEKEAIDQ